MVIVEAMNIGLYACIKQLDSFCNTYVHLFI